MLADPPFIHPRTPSHLDSAQISHRDKTNAETAAGGRSPRPSPSQIGPAAGESPRHGRGNVTTVQMRRGAGGRRGKAAPRGTDTGDDMHYSLTATLGSVLFITAPHHMASNPYPGKRDAPTVRGLMAEK
ncbi:hypothetical protein Bbelb_280190 [Branchiostoma belcheri]|nr:hypothetical protein Bbelb_280190 [Branchiostoma belcheri]